MNRIKNLAFYAAFLLLAALVLALIIYIVQSLNHLNRLENNKGGSILPDTVFVRKIEQVKIIEKHIPYRVELQEKKDTALRKEVELQEQILTGVELQGKELAVTKIDTAGQVTREQHQLPEFPSIRIDSQGNVQVEEDRKRARREKRKKILRKIGAGAAAAAGFIAGIILK